MIKKEKFTQQNLLGMSSEPKEPKKKKSTISEAEKERRKEKEEAHQSWKLLKSLQFNALLTERDKYLLKKYYHIENL